MLQKRISRIVVVSDRSSLPSSVIAGGVGRIELELAVFVVSSEEEGSSEGSGAADLSVVLFDVANIDDDFFDGDARPIFKSVFLSEWMLTWAFSRNRLIRYCASAASPETTQ